MVGVVRVVQQRSWLDGGRSEGGLQRSCLGGGCSEGGTEEEMFGWWV